MADLTSNKLLQRPALAAQLWSTEQHGEAWAAAAGGEGGEGGEGGKGVGKLPVTPVGREAEAFGDHTMFVAAHTLALLQAHHYGYTYYGATAYGLQSTTS